MRLTSSLLIVGTVFATHGCKQRRSSRPDLASAKNVVGSPSIMEAAAEVVATAERHLPPNYLETILPPNSFSGNPPAAGRLTDEGAAGAKLVTYSDQDILKLVIAEKEFIKEQVGAGFSSSLALEDGSPSIKDIASAVELLEEAFAKRGVETDAELARMRADIDSLKKKLAKGEALPAPTEQKPAKPPGEQKIAENEKDAALKATKALLEVSRAETLRKVMQDFSGLDRQYLKLRNETVSDVHYMRPVRCVPAPHASVLKDPKEAPFVFEYDAPLADKLGYLSVHGQMPRDICQRSILEMMNGVLCVPPVSQRPDPDVFVDLIDNSKSLYLGRSTSVNMAYDACTNNFKAIKLGFICAASLEKDGAVVLRRITSDDTGRNGAFYKVAVDYETPAADKWQVSSSTMELCRKDLQRINALNGP